MLDDNPNLKRLFESDRLDHLSEPSVITSAYDEMQARDATRSQQVQQLIDTGRVLTAEDYYRAAVILQCSRRRDERALAIELAELSADLSHEAAHWLAEAVRNQRDWRFKLLMQCLAAILWPAVFCLVLCCGPYMFMNHWPRHIELDLPAPERGIWQGSTRITHSGYGSKYFIWQGEGLIQCDRDDIERCVEAVVAPINDWFAQNDWRGGSAKLQNTDSRGLPGT